MADALADLGREPQVAQICSAIQTMLNETAWDRGLLRAPKEFWISVRRVCGYASAALDGGRMPDDTQNDPEDSPMGRLSEAGLLVTAQADDSWRTYQHSPMQVWARLHALVDDSPERGRPRADSQVDDPMHLWPAPDVPEMSARLNALADASVHSRAPGVLVAAVVHAELAAIRPFAHGSYLVARASSRMILRARDCDRLGVASVEFGQFAAGRPAYAKALQAYNHGSIEGMVAYLEAYGDWVARGIDMVSLQFGTKTRP